MNLLIIDNGTKLLKELEHLLPGHEVVHIWRDFTDEEVAAADLIILSGGSLLGLEGNEAEFARETELVKTAAKPIVAICFGSEIVTLAYGGTLRRLSERHQGIKEIEFLEAGMSRTISVYEGHRWITERVPDGFEVLARSKDGPELMRHTTKPILSIQFHPENFVDKTDGRAVLLNLLAKMGVAQ